MGVSVQKIVGFLLYPCGCLTLGEMKSAFQLRENLTLDREAAAATTLLIAIKQ